MKTNLTLTQRIESILGTYKGMNPASSVTQAFAFCIFGAHCTTLVNCDTDEELSKAITEKMISEAACTIIAIAKPYFNGTVEISAN